MDKQQQQGDLERIKGFRLFDDEFLNACLEGQIECTELVLRIILDDPKLKVRTVKTKKRMKNVHGCDEWLNIHAIDGGNRKSHIEIHCVDKEVNPRRARFYSNSLEAHAFYSKQDLDELLETFVIFVAEQDVFGGNEPLYRIEWQIGETGERFGNGGHIIYVNGADRNSETALGKLMHDFSCADPDELYYKPLADRIRYFKESTEGVEAMSSILDEMRNGTVEKL